MTQRHLYLRNPITRQPVGIIAVEINRDAREIRYALSVCSPSDKFDKHIAKEIANGRLARRPRILSEEVPQKSFEITNKIMTDIVTLNKFNSKNRSHIAMLAANGWLEHNGA